MATIKGMSLGSNKPYISISSLEALAYSISPFKGIICPIMDALRENVYTALFKNENNKFEKILDYTPLDLDDLLNILKEKDEEVMFTGDGLTLHKAYIKENFPKAHFAPNHLSIVHASSLGELDLAF